MIFRSNSKKERKTSNERWIEERKLFEIQLPLYIYRSHSLLSQLF